MQVFRTLVRRELGGYFFAFTGYIIIAGVLLLLGFSFVDIVGKLNNDATDAPVTEVFYASMYFWIILLLSAPVMTMRSFAQERALGTYETLMTSPVSDWQVVLSKFTGALLFYLITWAPLIGYVALLNHFTGQEKIALLPWTLATTYLGIFLIGCLFISMGVFASSLTRSQIVAAIISYAIGLALFILSLRPGVQVADNDWLAQLLAHTSMTEHMAEFARGVIDTRYLVYYASLTTLFLFLTHKVVESRRWK
ncbi:MAG TPA: ABC transporter permease [Methylomirabilota bacterium]|nr:ABC transporter permease [Methylomirabilota bacterium]